MDQANRASQQDQSLIVPSNARRSSDVRQGAVTPYGYEGEFDDSHSAVLEYLRLVRRNARTIVLASIGGLLLGFAVGIPIKPKYRATTTLEVLTINDDFMNMKQATPTTTNDNSYDTSEEETQAKLLQGSALIDRVTSQLDPDAPKSTKPRPAESGLRSWLHLSEPQPLSPRELLLSDAADSLKVKPAARTRVLEVSVDSTDRQLATDFVNALTREFIAQIVEARWSTTQTTSTWLAHELNDARDKLRHSEDALQIYARNSALIFTDDTTNIATEKLQQLQQSLSTATTDRIAKQARFKLAQTCPPESLADVLNDEALQLTQSKINETKQQVADLSTIFDPDYSKVRRAKAELVSWELAADSQRTDILARIKTDFDQAVSNEGLLSSAYETQVREVSGQDEKAIQYNILKRDVDSNRQLYDAMLQQMKQASIAMAMRSSNVRVVDPAVLPNKAVFPDFRINSVLGFVAGLLASICVVAMRERSDRTLQQPGHIKMWSDLPELGTIPSSGFDSHESVYGSSSTKGSRFSAGQNSAVSTRVKRDTNNGESGDAVELATFQRQPSLIAEAFRSVLTSVLFNEDRGIRPTVMVLTSANPNDGKTTVTCNLGIAAAEIRYRTIVIDADLRRPRMHTIFNVSNEQGLSTLLKGSLEELQIKDFVLQTNIPNLSILPAGPSNNAAAHLLYSPNFAFLLEQLRTQYDMILIDTPPMLQITDARVIGRLSDAVILVARAGKTTRDAVIAAKDRLHEDRTNVIGTVLNDWNPKRASGMYYAYSEYSPAR